MDQCQSAARLGERQAHGHRPAGPAAVLRAPPFAIAAAIWPVLETQPERKLTVTDDSDRGTLGTRDGRTIKHSRQRALGLSGARLGSRQLVERGAAVGPAKFEAAMTARLRLDMSSVPL